MNYTDVFLDHRQHVIANDFTTPLDPQSHQARVAYDPAGDRRHHEVINVQIGRGHARLHTACGRTIHVSLEQGWNALTYPLAEFSEFTRSCRGCGLSDVKFHAIHADYAEGLHHA